MVAIFQEGDKLEEILKLVSPGTALRSAIDDILRAGMGALIVIDSPNLKELMEGGFKVQCRLTPQRIAELAKMDGAIILSSDLKKILYSNVLLVPKTGTSSMETGTRHKAAERTSKQAETLAVAISERRKRVSLYHGNLRYLLKNTEEILSRATETLQILEKQRDLFDDSLVNLNFLEISDLVTVSDVCSVIQRLEILIRTSRIVERYLIELGREGTIIRMRLRELLKNVDRERELIFEDYLLNKDRITLLSEFNFDDLLNSENISKLLFSLALDDRIQSKGFRILYKTKLGRDYIKALLEKFTNVHTIFNAPSEELRTILDTRADHFQKELSSLREQIFISKKI